MGKPTINLEMYHKGNRKVDIVICRIPGELKHLSSQRNINQLRDSVSSGERKRKSLNRIARYGVAGLPIWDVIYDRRTFWNK